MTQELLDYFNGDELAASTWEKKYALEGEKTPEDMHRRMAKEFARIESCYPNPLSEEEIFNLFDHFKYVIPGGSIMSTLGSDNQKVSLSNCTVLSSPQDSINSIMDTCKDMANLFKRRCGVGFDISSLRPREATVDNSARTSTGAASFMDLFSTITNTIGQQGRRGALMITMNINHPDIEEFITKKQDLTKVTGANVSVQVSNEFMLAVLKDRDYILRYPIDITIPEDKKDIPYNTLVGDNGYYFKRVKARELWNTLIHCAWRTAEPGIIFSDNMINHAPDGSYPKFKMISTNPCFTGETLLLTEDGYDTFSNLAEICSHEDGFYQNPVWLINENGEKVKGKVWSNGYKHVIKVIFDNQKYIECTPDHKFKLLGGGECPARHLVGRIVRGYDDNPSKVTQVIDNGEIKEVFDFSLDGDNHWGVVGGVIAHNCGEIGMGADTCRLIHINLTSFVDNPYTDEASLNTRKLKEVARKAMRLADDIVDLEIESIHRLQKKFLIENNNDEYNLWKVFLKSAEEGRRTGLGFTGLADAIAMLGQTYGSKESLVTIRIIMEVLYKYQLMENIRLAEERGAFPSMNPMKLREDSYYHYMKKVYPDIADLLLLPRRNISWSTVAPTGTVSLMAQCSSGIEPVFKPWYIRRRKSDTVFNYVDVMGERYEEFVVVHPGLKKWAEVNGLEWTNDKNLEEVYKKSPYFLACAEDIGWDDRVVLQGLVQKYITHSISSTVNLPSSTTESEIDGLYLAAWKNRLKGITVYRNGSREGVLVEKPSKPTEVVTISAPKRPKVLEADYYEIKAKGEQFIVLVGLLNNRPYEIFTFRPKNPVNIGPHKGTITKVKKMHYRFDSDNIQITDLQLANENIEEQAATLYSSMLLRHGIDIEYIIKTAKKVNDNITSFSSAMCRVLAKYIDGESKTESCPECGANLIRENGCLICKNCGYSKCG